VLEGSKYSEGWGLRSKERRGGGGGEGEHGS